MVTISPTKANWMTPCRHTSALLGQPSERERIPISRGRLPGGLKNKARLAPKRPLSRGIGKNKMASLPATDPSHRSPTERPPYIRIRETVQTNQNVRKRMELIFVRITKRTMSGNLGFSGLPWVGPLPMSYATVKKTVGWGGIKAALPNPSAGF